MKKKYFKICPKCGSIDIHIETRAMGGYAENGGGTFCRTCGYGKGGIYIFPEIEESKILEFRNELKKKC